MRYLLEISYLGTNFHGWQKQPNAKSIQEEIEKALKLVFSEVFLLTEAAGRIQAYMLGSSLRILILKNTLKILKKRLVD